MGVCSRRPYFLRVELGEEASQPPILKHKFNQIRYLPKPKMDQLGTFYRTVFLIAERIARQQDGMRLRRSNATLR